MRTVYGPSNLNLNNVLYEAVRSILSPEKLVFYSERITAVSLSRSRLLPTRRMARRLYWISASYKVLGSSEKRKIFSATCAAIVISRQGDVGKLNTYSQRSYIFTFFLFYYLLRLCPAAAI